MKYKIFGAISCAIVIFITSINFTNLMHAKTSARIHQHLQAHKKTPCTAHSNDEFCTHLPLVMINTKGLEIPGKPVLEDGGKVSYTTAADGAKRITSEMAIIDSEETNNHTYDTPTITSNIAINVRGNSSRYFDKLGYRIKLITEDGENNPQSLMGMNAHHEWALHGPFLDKTLIRNYMWYNISGEIMDYAPNVRFCELFINGEYQGVYALVEIITAGKNGNRLNLSVNLKKNTFSGYLLILDRIDGEEDNRVPSFTTYTLRTKMKLEIAYPGTSNLTPEMLKMIKEDFSTFEKALYSYDYDNKKYGYTRFIDVDSFVDYFLINELTCNYDAGWLSTYIYKDISRKLRMCVWDFNSACDNYQETVINPFDFQMQNCIWYFMLMKDDNFTEKIIKRYWELRKTFFSEEYLENYINSTIEYLGPAIERNYEKWGYSFEKEYDMVIPSERNLRSYDEAVEQMKNFLKKRIEWLDENIEALKQYSAESRVKKFNENAN